MITIFSRTLRKIKSISFVSKMSLPIVKVSMSGAHRMQIMCLRNEKYNKLQTYEYYQLIL